MRLDTAFSNVVIENSAAQVHRKAERLESAPLFLSDFTIDAKPRNNTIVAQAMTICP